MNGSFPSPCSGTPPSAQPQLGYWGKRGRGEGLKQFYPLYPTLRWKTLPIIMLARLHDRTLLPWFRPGLFPATRPAILRPKSGIRAVRARHRQRRCGTQAVTKWYKCGPKGKDRGIKCNITGMLRLNSGILTATFSPTETKQAFTGVLVALKRGDDIVTI
jgi:hypothetical protein